MRTEAPPPASVDLGSPPTRLPVFGVDQNLSLPRGLGHLVLRKVTAAAPWWQLRVAQGQGGTSVSVSVCEGGAKSGMQGRPCQPGSDLCTALCCPHGCHTPGREGFLSLVSLPTPTSPVWGLHSVAIWLQSPRRRKNPQKWRLNQRFPRAVRGPGGGRFCVPLRCLCPLTLYLTTEAAGVKMTS